MVPKTGLALETSAPHSAYLKLIDAARKAVAVAMAVCGAGFVICANLDPGHGTDFGPRTRLLGIGFVIGVYACLIAVLVLIVEHLARPAKPTPFMLRSVFVRASFILIAVVAICVLMATVYGHGQAIGAVAGTFLVLAAVREHYVVRAVLAVLAAIVIGLTLLGTQSAYQYARWHANEIVSAGCELMERCQQSNSGGEIQPSDPRVPNILRKLGASSIVVGEQTVAVYVPGFARAEFLISRTPATTINPVWIKNIGKGGGDWKITDRLWMIVDD